MLTRPTSSKKKRYLQETTQKHEHDTELAPAIHLELFELTHRQENDDQVEDNIDGGGTPTVRGEVDALAVVLTVPAFPGKADGKALQRRRYDKGNYICNTEPNGGPDEFSKPPLREDAEIEEQDRYLRQCDGRQVQELGVVEDLR